VIVLPPVQGEVLDHKTMDPLVKTVIYIEFLVPKLNTEKYSHFPLFFFKVILFVLLEIDVQTL
jgi:hypothetical protein